MKKENRKVGLLIGAAAAIALVFGTGQMFAKTPHGAVAVSTTAQNQAPAAPSTKKMQKAQSFTGTVEESPTGAYELNTGGMVYRLSDQAQAKQFVGKQVTVTGTLISSSNTIQVQQIKEASAK